MRNVPRFRRCRGIAHARTASRYQCRTALFHWDWNWIHQTRPLALANAPSCSEIPQIRFRFRILMLLLHSIRYTNHGILSSISSGEIPPAAHCAAHHSTSSRPCIPPCRWVAVKFSLKGPAGRYHGSSLISRRRDIEFACGKMIERNRLQVIIRAYSGRIDRNSHVVRMMSGGSDSRVGLASWRLGSVSTM